ncbi:family A G protein-coupled receptor-like protein [Neoconidiobolus thromboides FSU 785]|nr:family A G protein-coupled receptor-like protein [Neoconidiobolus thromboides FSU 785]
MEDYSNITRTTSIINWCVLVMSIFSMTLNGIVFHLVLRKKQWSLDLKLIFMISLIDITTNLFNLFFAIMELNFTYKLYLNYPSYCQLMGFVVITLLISSSSFVIALSFERYLILCHPNKLNEKVVWSIPIIIISLVVIFGVISASTGQYIISSGKTYCMPNFKGSIISIIYYYILAFISIIGLQFLNYFFFNVLLKRNQSLEPMIRNNQRRLRLMKRSQNPNHLELALPEIPISNPEEISRKIAIRAILFLIAYNISFLPNLIALLWDIITQEQRPSSLDNLTAVTLHSIELFNPILVLFLHSKINKDFFSLMSKIKSKLF